MLRGLVFFGLLACSDPTVAPKPPPSDLPAWSTAAHIHWAPLAAEGERLLLIDRPGSALDAVLADPDVATIINDRFQPLWLHPRARPWITERLGWPAVAALAPDGCLRLAGPAPDSGQAMVDWLNSALHAQALEHRLQWPAPGSPEAAPADGGRWTTEDPLAAKQHFDAAQGVPALIHQGIPYLYGDLAPAGALAREGDERAAAWLRTHPEPTWPSREGPLVRCSAMTTTPLSPEQRVPPVQLPGVAGPPTER